MTKIKVLIIIFLLIYLAVINLLPFQLFYERAQKHAKSNRQVPYLLLMLLIVMGGGAGVVLAAQKFGKRLPATLLSVNTIFIVIWALLFVSSSVRLFIKADAPGRADGESSISAEVAEDTVFTSTTPPARPDAATENVSPESDEIPRQVPGEESDKAEDAEEAARRSAEEASRQAEEESRQAEEAARQSAEEASRQESEAARIASEEASRQAEEEASRLASEEESRRAAEPRYVSIAAIGDMLMHIGCSGLAIQPDGSMYYDVLFDPIRAEIAGSDISVVNNEVPFGGDEKGLQTYPNFNVFTSLGDAEIRTGFNVILNATNHVRDQWDGGILNTFNYWKQHPEIYSLGIHDSPEDQNYIRIIERNGIRIALLNYTYGCNAGIPEDKPYMIDLMRDQDRDKIANDLLRAEAGADFTIVFPHWGEEYQLKQTAKQEEWAQFFTEYGADLIIGTHPHVLEPIKTVTSPNGNTSLCYYSLGNYISLQDETMSVLGGMAKVLLVADADGVRIADHSIQYLVTQYGADLSYAYVVKLENYTDELAGWHGIPVLNLPGNGLNVYYPYSVATLHRIINEVNSY